MKAQLNEVKRLQKIAGILKENEQSNLFKIQQSGISLDSIKNGLIRTIQDEPFDDDEYVIDMTIDGIKDATNLEDLASYVNKYSDGYFDPANLYDLILDLIDQGTIK